MTRKALGRIESVAGNSQTFSPSNCNMTRLVLVSFTELGLNCKAEQNLYKCPVKNPKATAMRRGQVTFGKTQTCNNPSCKVAAGNAVKLPP